MQSTFPNRKFLKRKFFEITILEMENSVWFYHLQCLLKIVNHIGESLIKLSPALAGVGKTNVVLQPTGIRAASALWI
jgi:hypothetical protein